MSRRRRFKQEAEPARCRCNQPTDTPEWHGKKRSGSGLTGHRGALHGDPFARHDKGCVHSELQLTTAPARKRAGANRLRLQ